MAAFVDLKKAFDTVNTKILINKLRYAGIRGNVLRWCVDYLSNRSQCTFVNNVKSTFLPVTSGVPQGSVLGPLFFLVYVNDIQNAVVDCDIKLYADDTVLYQSGTNCVEAEVKLQRSINDFKNWCDINKLTINASKTKIDVVCKPVKSQKVQKCRHTFRRGATKTRPLIQIFGYHIRLNPQLNKMTLLAKLKKYLTDEAALQIYKTMLLPYFDYADVIFDQANSRDIEKLQTLQNKG